MKKIVPILIGLLVVCIAAFIAYRPPRATETRVRASVSSLPVVATSSVSAISQTYGMEQISVHLDASSCWTAIDGKVYDLTSWIAKHPGGEGTILSICGKDGSAAFDNQHNGQRRPEQILATYKIGDLK